MPGIPVIIDSETAARLKRELADLRRETQTKLAGLARDRLITGGGGVLRIGKTNEEIDALSSDTPGSGGVSLYRLDSDGDLEDTGEDIAAKNLSGGAVATDTYVGLAPAAGVWWIIWEDCS